MATVAEKKQIMPKSVFILALLLLTPQLAYADPPEDAEGGGAAASDPTAAVNFQDVKLRYFNLTQGNEEYVLVSIALTPPRRRLREMEGSA